MVHYLWRGLFYLMAFIVTVTICPTEPNFTEIGFRPPRQEVSRGTERVLVMEATAYCHTGNQTKTGTWPEAGRTVAVDPEVIPLGSRVWVEGLGVRVAEDTGGLINGNRIDIYMASQGEALQWGKREVKISVLD